MACTIPSCGSSPVVGFGSGSGGVSCPGRGISCGSLGPACTTPSCASSPVVGFGSAGARGLGYYGWGGLGYYGYPTFSSGSGGLSLGYRAGETSATLGILAGVTPSAINQIPPSEVVIQPPPSVVTLPGSILSASCEPVSVGGYNPCAVGGVQAGSALTGGNWCYGQVPRRGGSLGSMPGPCLSIC